VHAAVGAKVITGCGAVGRPFPNTVTLPRRAGASAQTLIRRNLSLFLAPDFGAV